MRYRLMPRRALLGGLLLCPTVGAAQTAGTLRGKISQLFIFGSGEALFLGGSADPHNPATIQAHGNHFVPSAVAENASLIGFRILQGLGGGLIMPVGMTILMSVTRPEERGRMMAVMGIPMLFGPVLGPTLGGLLVHERKAPKEWSFMKYNTDWEAIVDFLESVGSVPVRVPHRANRAVIFDSDLFHATDSPRFREGYANRRINVTLLYGQRAP